MAKAYQRFIENIPLRRIFVLLVTCFILWLARGMMNMILFTFIFSFLVTRFLRFVQRHVPHTRPWMIVVPLYILIIAVIYWAITHYVPVLVDQTGKLATKVYDFYQSPSFDSNSFIKYLNQAVNQFNLQEQFKKGFSTILAYVTSVGSVGVTIVLSFILSFFYTVDIDQLDSFSHLFLRSRIGWFFKDLWYFARKFVNTFGVVMEAQLFIATVNTVITTITLAFMKMPNLASLAIMVFLLSLIPVAGAIISCIPLSLVAYSVGGIQDVIYILLLIIAIHALETYVLNPQFMSSRTQLPIFFTFVILLVADWLFGTWGLIVGIPVFTFLLDILGVKSIADPEKPYTRKWIKAHAAEEKEIHDKAVKKEEKHEKKDESAK